MRSRTTPPEDLTKDEIQYANPILVEMFGGGSLACVSIESLDMVAGAPLEMHDP